MNKKITIVLTLCLAHISSSALAQVTIGTGIVVGHSPYANYKTEWSPIPIVQIQKGYFFIDTLKMGVNLLEDDATRINLHTTYLPLHFKSSKTDNKALKALKKRQSTLLAGVGFSHQFNDKCTTIKANIDVDVLGRSDSLLVETGINHNFLVSNNLMISPSAGIIWTNKKHNNYYYGVSTKESARSGLSRYKAKASVQTYIGVSINYQLTEDIALVASGRMDFLSNTAKKSPMVNKSATSVIAVGMTYRFK